MGPGPFPNTHECRKIRGGLASKRLMMENIDVVTGTLAQSEVKPKKKVTPCGTQTHNLQIRSLTRYSIAPTGR